MRTTIKSKLPQRNSQFVQSLSDGIQLLEYIALKKQNASLATIVRDLRWTKNKTWRMLRTLYHGGFLDYDPLEKTYRLGSRILVLHQSIIHALEIQPRFSHKFLEELTEITQEAAVLAVLRGARVAVIDLAMNPSLLIRVGDCGPAFCVAHGKVFLAEMEPKSALQVLRHSNIQPFTPRTKTDIKEIMKELERVRVQGYAIEDGEFNTDIWGLAVPVRDSVQVVASVGVMVPTSHITDKKIPELVEQVKRIARSIESSVVAGHFNRVVTGQTV